MQLLELAKQGIVRIRKPTWEPEVFLKLVIIDGALSAFAELHEPHPRQGQEGCPYQYQVTLQLILQLAFGYLGKNEIADEFQGDDWEEYKQ